MLGDIPTTDYNNCMRQSDPYVSFLLKQATQKVGGGETFIRETWDL